LNLNIKKVLTIANMEEEYYIDSIPDGFDWGMI
jgi:hypothetical protein